MVGFGVTRRKVALRLALAAGVPVLGIGFAFVYAFVRDHGPTGAWRFVLLLAVPLVVVYTFGCNREWPGVLAFTGLMICWGLAGEAMEERTLAERGRTDNCLVEAKKKEEIVQPIGRSAMVTIRYVHHLQCQGGGPDRMVTYDSAVAFDEGTFVTVLWDPSQRIAPQPAGRQGDSRRKFRLAVGAASAGALFVLLDVLIDVRCHLRPRMMRQTSRHWD